jgi:hypothetical protein
VGADGSLGRPGDPVDGPFATSFARNQPQNGLTADRRRRDVHAGFGPHRAGSGLRSRSTSPNEGVSCPDGLDGRVRLDPFAKRMLLAGPMSSAISCRRSPRFAAAWEAAPSRRVIETRTVAPESIYGSLMGRPDRSTRHQSSLTSTRLATPAISQGLRAAGRSPAASAVRASAAPDGPGARSSSVLVRHAQSAALSAVAIGTGALTRSYVALERGADDRRGPARLDRPPTVQRAQTAQPRYGVGPVLSMGVDGGPGTRNGRVAACGAGRFIGSTRCVG